MKNEKSNKEKKKKGMVLSDRDKKLAGVVGAVGVAAISYLTISDLMQKNQQLADEYNTIQTELTDKQNRAARKAALTAELKNLNAATLETASQYYGTVNQGDFIFLIDKFINDSEIDLKKVSFEETTELDFPEEEATEGGGTEGSTASSSSSASSGDEQASNQTVASSTETGTSSSSSASSENSETSTSSSAGTEGATTPSSGADSSTSDGSIKYQNTNITQMTASIEFEGTYTEIIKLLDMVDNNDKTIVSSELQLDRNDEGTRSQMSDPPLSGTILLRFYQVEDVERYVPKPESDIDKTPIPVAANTSPFNVPSWLVLTEGGESTGGTDSATTGTTATPTSDATSSLAPSYLEQLKNTTAATGGNGLASYFNTQTVYRFESPIELLRKDNGQKAAVTVDSGDFKEGSGSNAFKLPASSGSVTYEMPFGAPEVSLNSQPTNISFAMYASAPWKGETGLILQNASGQVINLQLEMANDWTGWREVSFSPSNIPNATYPLTVKGFYFKTAAGTSPETTIKLDNLAVHYLVTN